MLEFPEMVKVRGFKAYEGSGSIKFGKPTLTQFTGSITVPIRLFIAAVVLGEIDVANDIGDDGVWHQQRGEALEAQGRAVLNVVLITN